MLFAGLLRPAQEVPCLARSAAPRAWMRGHLWLGLLSFPMILLHGGFHFGGSAHPRADVVVRVSFSSAELLGAVLQHYMPQIHTNALPMETIYEQIDRVRGQLARKLPGWSTKPARAGRGCFPRHGKSKSHRGRGRRELGRDRRLGHAGGRKRGDELRRFLQVEIQPFLGRAGAHGTRLGTSTSGARPCSGSCVFWCRPTCIPTSTISRTSARRNANSTGSPGFTRSCTVGCLCTFRFPTRCFCWARGTRWQL